MFYKFIPNSIDFSILEPLTQEYVLKMQVVYRKGFESIIKRCLEMKKFDDRISSVGAITLIDDMDYNVYHKFSTLGSSYIFIRNNFHIERLTQDELGELKRMCDENGEVSSDFIMRTYQRVLGEEGDFACYGTPLPQNMLPSRSIVIEFAYDAKKTSFTLEENLKVAFAEVFLEISEILKTQFDMPCSMLIWNGFDNILKPFPFKTSELPNIE